MFGWQAEGLSHEVTVLPDTIEDVAEFALAKVIEAGSGVAKNVINFLRDLEEVKHIFLVHSDFVMLHTTGKSVICKNIDFLSRAYFMLWLIICQISLYNC